MWRGGLLVLCVWLQLDLAEAREVVSGEVVRVPAVLSARYTHILWVEAHGEDDLVELVAFPGPTEVGASYDIVDERGHVARARVVRVEPSICGPLTYTRARAQIAWPGMSRRTVGAVVALGPARGRPPGARVLTSSEAPSGEDPGRLFIDVDGDGRADLARQLTLECGSARGRSLACVETWVRDEGTGKEDGWRRVMRAEVGPCG